jgi:penicillin-binding protein activator
MNYITVNSIMALSLVATTLGCYSGSATNVRRAHPDEQIDLSGNWNDTDANHVAAVMIQDCLSRPWATQFQAKHGRPPVIRMYPIRNRTADHMNTRFFTKQVEQELLNSGIVQVVADLTEAQDTRYERSDQAHHASAETMKQGRNETGSDYILNGWVVDENDAVPGREVRAYVATMELIHSETNVKVWMKVHRIKKDITRAETAW